MLRAVRTDVLVGRNIARNGMGSRRLGQSIRAQDKDTKEDSSVDCERCEC